MFARPARLWSACSLTGNYALWLLGNLVVLVVVEIADDRFDQPRRLLTGTDRTDHGNLQVSG